MINLRGAGGFISEDAENFSAMHGKGKLRWLVGNYEAGDVVFHNPWMIHAATKNGMYRVNRSPIYVGACADSGDM